MQTSETEPKYAISYGGKPLEEMSAKETGRIIFCLAEGNAHLVRQIEEKEKELSYWQTQWAHIPILNPRSPWWRRWFRN